MKFDSIVCFAGGDWWYHHPHSYNHLMKVFSDKYKVLYINSIPVGSLKIGGNSKGKIKNKLISILKYFRKVNKNLYIFTPFFIPFSNNWIILRINIFLLRLQIKAILKLNGFYNPLIWITNPYGYLFINNNDDKVLYQIVDKISAYRYSNEMVVKFDEYLSQKASFIITPGKKIYDEKHTNYPDKTFRIKHGVDVEHFSHGNYEKPLDFPDNNRPVFTYWGSIDYKKIYYDLLKLMGEKTKDVDFLFIGREFDFPIDDFKDMDNIHFIGSRDYSVLPYYAEYSTGFIIPWDPNDDMNKHASPIKLREYLAMGKPIVTTYIPEFDEFKEIIYISNSNEEFVDNIQRAINENDKSLQNKRKEFVLKNNWRYIADEIESIIINNFN